MRKVMHMEVVTLHECKWSGNIAEGSA